MKPFKSHHSIGGDVWGAPSIEYGEMGTIETGINTDEIDHAFENLSIILNTSKALSLRVLAKIGIHLLASTQPKVPFKTGKLRGSGRATIVAKGVGGFYMDVAKGIVSTDSSGVNVNVNLTRLRSKRVRGLREASVYVSYNRLQETGSGTLDIAVFAHEMLFPYEMRFAGYKPAARQPGTGPKFLETTYQENYKTYRQWIEEALGFRTIEEIVEKNLKILKRSTNQYMVDVTMLREEAVEKSIDSIMGKEDLIG